MKEFSSPYFLYVGNAYPHKNLKRVVEAMRLLNEDRSEKILFLIASSRTVFTWRLEKFIEKEKAKDFVKLLGFVEEKELSSLYEKSVGFIFPSLMEGFGLPGLEAIKAGTVLLASDISVFREIYGDNCFYFEPTNVESIASALRKILSLSSAERKSKISNGLKFIKRYSWENMARETIKIYESIFQSLH